MILSYDWLKSDDVILIIAWCYLAQLQQMYMLFMSSLSSTDLELHLTTSELWFGQEQEGILP